MYIIVERVGEPQYIMGCHSSLPWRYIVADPGIEGIPEVPFLYEVVRY